MASPPVNVVAGLPRESLVAKGPESEICSSSSFSQQDVVTEADDDVAHERQLRASTTKSDRCGARLK